MINIQNYKWLLISACFSALTIIIIKYYENYNNNWLLMAAVLSECGLIYGYIQLLKLNDILTQFSLVKIIAILFVVIPSITFSWTKLTISKSFGILFGIIAIYLLK
jgi:hypothetical protein